MDALNLMKIRSIVAFSLLAIPIILVLSWHLCNHGVPTGDSADYTEASIRIARDVRQQLGPIGVMGALLNTRGWRPSVFSALAVPAFLLTGNDLVAGPAVTLLLIYVALMAYLYRLVLLWSEDPLVAAATCAAVLTMPAIVAYSLIFFSESAWLLFSIACVYHLLRSGPFVTIKHAAIAGAFGGLMIAVRPVESSIVLGAILPFMMAPAVRSKVLSLRGSLIIVGVFSIPAAVLLFSTWAKGIGRVHIWGVCMIAVVLSVLLARRYGWTPVAFFGTLTSVSCIWWGGFMPQLYVWAQVARGGAVDQVTNMRSPAQIAQALLKETRDYGELQLGALLCLAIVLIGSTIVSARHKKRISGQTVAESARLLLYGASILLVVFAATYTSFGSDRRRGILAFVLFSAPLIAVSARRSRIVLAGVFLLIAMQCATLSSAITRTPVPSWVFRNTSGHPEPIPVDRNLEIAQILMRYVTTGSNVAVFTTTVFGGPRVYEPNSLRIVCLRENLGFSANSLADFTGGYDEVMRHMRNERIWKYVLLDSLEECVPTAVLEPMVLVIRELNRRTKAGDTPGLRIIGRFSIGGRVHTLFRVLQEGAPPNIADNAAAELNGSRAIATTVQKGFLTGNLNDGTDLPWGSLDGTNDLYAGVVLPVPRAISEMRLRLFTPEGRPHMRDIRIVAADTEGVEEPDWKVLRARLRGSAAFASVITVPPLPDNSLVTIEIDQTDPNWRPRTIWGFGCLRSLGDVPNYLGGQAVYVRELEMH